MLPPQKVSYGRTRRRRSHMAMEAGTFANDPLSQATKQHHRAAGESGYVRAGLRITVPKLGIGVAKKKNKKG